MTNIESYLNTSIIANEAGKLGTWDAEFISSIVNEFGTDKKSLRKLSSKQFLKIREIANKTKL